MNQERMEAESRDLCEQLACQAREVVLFVHALKGLWAEVPWEDVEPFAQRAWDSILWTRDEVPADYRAWSEVRAFVHEAWVTPGGAAR